MSDTQRVPEWAKGKMKALAKRRATHFYPLRNGDVLAVLPSPTAWTYALLGRLGAEEDRDWPSWPTEQWQTCLYRVQTTDGHDSPLGVCAYITDMRGRETHRIYLAHAWDDRDWSIYQEALDAGLTETWMRIDGDAWPSPVELPAAGPGDDHRQPGSRHGKAKRRRKSAKQSRLQGK